MSTVDRPIKAEHPEQHTTTGVATPELFRRAFAHARAVLATRFGPIEWVLLAALVVLPSAFIWHFASPGYFLWDDFHNLYWAHNTPAVWSYLFAATYGDHMSPAHRLGYLVLHRVAPMNFDVAVATLLACHTVSAVLLQRVLTVLFGRAWWTFVLALAWAISAVYVSGFMWFAAGLHSIPAITATLASIHGYLCWRVTGRRAWLVWSLVAMCVGLGFYLKSLLIPLYLVLIRILILDPEARLRDSLRSIRDEWRVWLAYATVCGVFLFAYLVGDYAQHYDPDAHATVAEILRYLHVFWFEGFSPMVLGVRVPIDDHDAWHQVVIVAAQGALIAAIAWSVARRGRVAWRAWAFLLVAVAANALIVVGRVSEVGADFAAYAARYYLEPTLLVALAIAFAFGIPRLTPRVHAVESTVPAEGRWRSRRQRLAASFDTFRAPTAHAATTALVALLVYVGVAWATWESLSKRSPGRPGTPEVLAAQAGPLAHAYFDNLRADLEAVRRRGVEPSLLDHDVPETVVSPLTNLKPAAVRAGVRYSLLSSVLPLFNEQASFNRPGNLDIVRSDGRLQSTRFVTAAGGSPAELRRTGRPRIRHAHIEHRRGDWCVLAEVTSALDQDISVLEWEPRPHLRGRDWWLRARYRTHPVDAFGLETNAGTEWIYEGDKLPPKGFFGTAIIHLTELPEGVPTNAGIRIGIPPSGRLCLRSLEIGYFDPPPP